ncbi:MAG TPA: hypothetical protein P5136_00805 [Methanofastidiosum sp.]|nr:hypothetical protein [Methanofastidiosum sp.]
MENFIPYIGACCIVIGIVIIVLALVDKIEGHLDIIAQAILKEKENSDK